MLLRDNQEGGERERRAFVVGWREAVNVDNREGGEEGRRPSTSPKGSLNQEVVLPSIMPDALILGTDWVE